VLRSKSTPSPQILILSDLSAVATLDGGVKTSGTRVVLFELSLLASKAGGVREQAAEFIQMKPSRASELSRRGNDTIAVVFPVPLQPGEHIRLRFTYAGSVLSDAGGGLLYVGARGTWYPNAVSPWANTISLSLSAVLVSHCHRERCAGAGGRNFLGRWISERPNPYRWIQSRRICAHSTAKADDIVVDAYAARGTESQRSTPSAANTSRNCFAPCSRHGRARAHASAAAESRKHWTIAGRPSAET